MVQKRLTGDWSVLCWTGDLSRVHRCLSPPTGNPESSPRTVTRNSGSWQKMDGFHSDSDQIKRLMAHDLGDTALPSSYLSFSADTYFKCPDTWGITPMQILPDKFSALTTSISDSAPQIGTRPLRKRPHLWGHISIQPAVLNGKEKTLSHLTLCFSVITPVMSICGPHYGLFPSVFMPANRVIPSFLNGGIGTISVCELLKSGLHLVY